MCELLWAEAGNGRNQLAIYSYPSLTRLRSCQALNLTYRGQYSVSVCGFLLLFVLRDTCDDAGISCHGDMRVLWGPGLASQYCAGVVMTLLSAGNSWSTCQSRANPSPPLKWGYQDRDMTRITWSVLRQRNMLAIAIGLHSANIWNLSSIQPVLNCNFILTFVACIAANSKTWIRFPNSIQFESQLSANFILLFTFLAFSHYTLISQMS